MGSQQSWHVAVAPRQRTTLAWLHQRPLDTLLPTISAEMPAASKQSLARPHPAQADPCQDQRMTPGAAETCMIELSRADRERLHSFFKVEKCLVRVPQFIFVRVHNF